MATKLKFVNILVLDSGQGGKVIFEKLKEELPQHKITYFADTCHFPYSEKDTKELRKILRNHISEFPSVTIVVLACNTATVVALDYLREQFPNKQFVGTVPAVKLAAENLPLNSRILVLATKNTANGEYLQKLISQHPHQEFIALGSTELVEAAEAADTKRALSLLEKIKESVGLVNGIVLGCTHFRLVEDQIRAVFGYSISLFGSEEGVVKRVKSKIS